MAYHKGAYKSTTFAQCRCDMLTAHAFLCTCQLRAKVDDVGESDLLASWKQDDVRLVFKVFSR